MQLHNVFFTHNSRKNIILSQLKIQHVIPTNVCADSIFKLAFTICVKQDSICQDFQWCITTHIIFNIIKILEKHVHYISINDAKNK